MADFCWDCFAELFSPDIPVERNDLAGLCSKDTMIHALCEGCGEGWFDFEGRRIETMDKGVANGH